MIHLMNGFQNTLFYSGQPKNPTEPISLRAGALTLTYENGYIRNICLNNQMIVNMIYVAIRDHNWGTVPAVLSAEKIEVKDDSFVVQFTSTHQQNNVNFEWQGGIVGNNDSSIQFTMDGKAQSTFLRNRIGFCVLHPMRLAGIACKVEHVDHSFTDGYFPKFISPHQPFKDIRSISHQVIPGVGVKISFDGDTFEMEDQRNWTDASFKTYCTPLGLKFPVQVNEGTSIKQSILISIDGAIPVIRGKENNSYEITLEVDDSQPYPLPQIGLGYTFHNEPLTGEQIERFKTMNLAHLRVDLHLERKDEATIFVQATIDSKLLNIPLLIAVHLTQNVETELELLCSLIKENNTPIWGIIVFKNGEKTTPEKLLLLTQLKIQHFFSGIKVGGGTDAFFTEINRVRPTTKLMDFIIYSNNPQVHAFDNTSLIENLGGQQADIESAKQFANGKPILVSPITFKMRWNPDATSDLAPPAPGELPKQVDTRQLSLFGAGWTLGSIKAMIYGTADYVTYYEMLGWLGIMENSFGSFLPEKFPSVPNSVFPLYHIFAFISKFVGGTAYQVTSSHPLSIDGIYLTKGNYKRLLITNYTGILKNISIIGITGKASIKILNTNTLEEACIHPAMFQARKGASINLNLGELKIPAYAIVCVDLG
jgi:hypothetical protein